jgi:hypothetical protein
MRLILSLIFIVSLIELNAQTDKNYILRTNFGYKYNHKDILDDIPGYFGTINNDLIINLSAAKKLKTNFYYGLGLIYNVSKSEINPDSDVPKYDSSQSYGYISRRSYNNTTISDNIISPIVFIQYFMQASDRVSIAMELYLKYDFVKNSTNHIWYSPANVFVDEYKTKVQKQYINLGINPTLRFYIVRNFGMEFTFGLFEYQSKVKDSRAIID